MTKGDKWLILNALDDACLMQESIIAALRGPEFAHTRAACRRLIARYRKMAREIGEPKDG